MGDETIDGEPTEVLTITIPVRMIAAPGYTRGHLHMKYEGVVVSRDGEDIAAVSPCVGGGLDINDYRTGETWSIDTEHVWKAFEQALIDRRTA